MLRGHVDIVSKMMVVGWALSETEPELSPELEIYQNGKVVAVIKPMFPYPNLRPALKLPSIQGPQLYEWRFPFPLFYGLVPDVPFDIRFRENGHPLTLGNNRVIPLVENLDKDAHDDLSHSTFIFPYYRADNEELNLSLNIVSPELTDQLSCLKVGEKSYFLEVKKGHLAETKNVAYLQDSASRINLRIPYNQLSQAKDFLTNVEVINTKSEAEPRIAFHNSLQKLHIPKTLVQPSLRIADIPEVGNVTRISGIGSSESDYLIGGMTTFLQLNAISEYYFSKSITEFDNVVDWGVGCGRVVRHFWESVPHLDLVQPARQRIIGFDIDEVNISWCQRNMPHANCILIEPDKPLPIESASTDFLYGISVMTHLSENYQHRWLAEIRRVMKPGGCVILTTHGESNWYRNCSSLQLPFVEKFGFFDGIADLGLGTELSTYYRATYHSRAYIKTNWTQYFTLIDIIPSANAFTQDFVVLKA